MSSNSDDKPKVIALPPLILAATLASGFTLEALRPLPLPARGLAYPIGVLFVVGAIAIAALAVREMAASETPLDVRKPTRRLVTTGVFALSRNPIYLGMVLLCLGIALVAGSLWLLLLTLAFAYVLEKGVIAQEETYLEAKFGEIYRRYKTRVRRWI